MAYTTDCAKCVHGGKRCVAGGPNLVSCGNNQHTEDISMYLFPNGARFSPPPPPPPRDDVASLQADLVNLEHWSSQSGLSFNKSKCKHQSITRKIVPFTSSYKLEDTKVTTTDCERDLGVWVSSNLTWKKQVCNQTSKANKSLGYIKRNTRFVKSTEARRMFYLALVRSHFGYATQIWAPQSIELINHLE